MGTKGSGSPEQHPPPRGGFCSNPEISQASHCVLWVSAPPIQGRWGLDHLSFPSSQGGGDTNVGSAREPVGTISAVMTGMSELLRKNELTELAM